MAPNDRLAELFELAEAFCQNELTPEQKVRLEQLVVSDEELRRAYVRYLHMQVCLRRVFEGGAAERQPVPTTDPPAARPPAVSPAAETATLNPGCSPADSGAGMPSAAHRWTRRVVAACIVGVVGAAISFWLKPPGSVVEQRRTVATLTNAAGCVWEMRHAPQLGQPLEPGRFDLSAGMAEITSVSGAVVVVEAPAVLELLGPSSGFLHAGRIVVRVPPAATGFAIETQRAKLVDRGTEFGVGVGTAGETIVQVFDGIVEADLKNGVKAEPQRLSAGQTVRIDAESQPLANVPQRFVRRLPDPKERGADWLVPYNQQRFDSVHIVPAPAKIVIDGDLSDWDRSGAFFVRFVEPYSRDYYVEGAMMYDAQYLYIGAHVGDPAPMRSVIDPKTDPTAGWKAGAVQVRISTDRAADWPLQAEGSLVRKAPLRPQDKSDRLVHLTMWYYQPEALPCLHIQYGMDFHGEVVNPPDVRCAFKKDADGRAYVLEYAIPWRLLHAETDPPRGGDVLAACWNVHWSDEDGRLWKGYLVDVLNPQEKGYTYQRAATWGRATFHAKGNLPPGTVVPR
jgi:hypothetical protein